MIEIKFKTGKRGFPTQNLGSVKYGTVFSGILKGINGIFIITCVGTFRLDGGLVENPVPFCNRVSDNNFDNVENFIELKATLTVENAKV
jgi:hypothetical protein